MLALYDKIRPSIKKSSLKNSVKFIEKVKLLCMKGICFHTNKRHSRINSCNESV